MKFRLRSLVINLRRGEVIIEFADLSYFWGQMGAGKTSIVRLVDYCLGGGIELSPAMQSEFVSATLNLSLARQYISVERPRDSDRVIASWGTGDGGYKLSLPARKPEGEVIPDTGSSSYPTCCSGFPVSRRPGFGRARSVTTATSLASQYETFFGTAT